MGLKIHILLAFLLIGRFVVDIIDPVISSDILALLIMIMVTIKHPNHPLALIGLMISLSVLYVDILFLLQITDHVFAALGALVTMFISFFKLPTYGVSS